jgi:hypothetical protein
VRPTDFEPGGHVKHLPGAHGLFGLVEALAAAAELNAQLVDVEDVTGLALRPQGRLELGPRPHVPRHTHMALVREALLPL